MLDVVIPIALSLMTAALLLNFWRVVRGPSAVDRVLAVDTMYINTIAFLVLLGVLRNSSLYFEAALVIAMVGFIGTAAWSRYLLRRDVIE
jgi:multicomponent K+:H+ antiporter subunit F